MTTTLWAFESRRECFKWLEETKIQKLNPAVKTDKQEMDTACIAESMKTY